MAVEKLQRSERRDPDVRQRADKPTLFLTTFTNDGKTNDKPKTGDILRITGGGFEPGTQVWLVVNVPDGPQYGPEKLMVSPDGTFLDGGTERNGHPLRASGRYDAQVSLEPDGSPVAKGSVTVSAS